MNERWSITIFLSDFKSKQDQVSPNAFFGVSIEFAFRNVWKMRHIKGRPGYREDHFTELC